MTITAPVPADALPVAPSFDDPDNFDPEADAFVAAQGPFGIQMNALASNVYSNAMQAYMYAMAAALSASDASSSAAAAASASNAVKWVSGTTYTDGDSVWSPANRLPYRRIGAGAGTIDPSSDSAHWAIQLLGIGLGGLTLATSISLTNTSPGGITVTPSGPGFYAILADATTCQKAALLHSFYNAGDYDYGIKDAAGNQLGWIRANSGVSVGLSDNSTTAGVWSITGSQKIGATAALYSSAVTPGSGVNRVELDANRTFLIYGGLYCVVYDKSTNSFGAPAFIRTASGAFVKAILSAANQVMIASCDTTAFELVTVTVSGTGVTVNSGTKATATFASNINSFSDLIAVGASWAIGYALSSTCEFRAITLSGTTPTLGSATTLSASSVSPILFATGSVLRAVHFNASDLKCMPYTVSGTSATSGTGATVGTSVTAGSDAFRAFMNGNGNIVVQVLTAASNNLLAIFKLTGTTEAATTATLSPTVGNYPGLFSDFIQISASKVVLGYVDGSSLVYFNILTDTAGTASLGTAITYSYTSPTLVTALMLTGSNARFAFVHSQGGVQITLDCSSASPTLVSVQSFHSNTSVPSASSSREGKRSHTLLKAGTNAYSTGKRGDNNNADAQFSVANVRQINTQASSFNFGVGGAAANESWVCENFVAGLGCSIKRLEACA